MPRTAFNSRRTRTSCSVIALATVLTVGATPAAAQSFLGTGTYVTNPNATGIQTGAGTTTINLNSGQTVIDWVPSDPIPGSTITFQTAGTTATFTTASGNFAVLNRITPTDMSRAIAMNGTVNGRIGGVNGVQGGSVYFYSPNGFVFGGSSVFNVGSLVVTTSPIQLTGNLFINGADNTVVFGQTPNPNAAIINNAAIDANFVPFGVGGSGTSYVAMVAPRVVHNGSIDVNGSAALVGAEAATISFSPDGLFDIQVTVGTDDANGVAVNGDIGGVTPDSDEQQRIFLVAVPKNDAMTMVIGAGADLGFDLAGSAAIDDNGAIILSAGKDITNGVIGDTSAGHSETAVADFWFTGAHATNNLFGDATGTAYLYSTIGAPGQQTTIFDNDVTVHGDVGTHMASSDVGSTLTVGGDLYLSSDAFATESGGSAAGGSTVIFAQNGGSLTVSGDALLTANGHGGSTESPGEAGGTGTGGLVSILALSDGTLSFEGALEAQANGYGGQSFDGDGGLGQGGSLERPGGGGVQILASDATLTVTGSVDLTATGEGGGGSGTGNVSGNGVGGDIFVQSLAGGSLQMASLEADATGRGGLDFGGEAASGDGFGGGWNDGGGIFIESNGGSSLIVTGAVDLFANGEAGSGGECFSCGGAAGDGFGGDIFALANGTASTLTFGDLDAQANGYGGLGSVGNGGLGDGGSVQLSAWGSSTTTVNGDADLDAIGYGGDVVANSTGGNGVGGAAFLTTANTGTLQVNGDAFVDAYAEGGNVFNEIGGIGGGDATGGNAQVLASGGTLNVDGSLFVNAYGQGGFAFNGTGGDGTGNSAQIRATGGDIDVDGSAHVDASGYGGNGEIGGSGTGGGTIATFTPGAMIFAQNGDIDIGFSATVAADGIGAFGNDGAGGNGTGGWASIESGSGSTVDVLGTVEAGAFISARGEGGGSEVDAGGDGFGGTATAVSTSGDLYFAGDLIMNAGATGGTGGTSGGDAIARVTPPEQEETTAAVALYATGGGLIEVDGHTSLTTYAEGGTGYDGAGGLARGGEIDVVVGGVGGITLAELTATADALGGAGGNGGNGGNATGGNIDIGWNLSGSVTNGTITATDTWLSANGEGGAGGFGATGGDGGSGTGGDIIAVGSAAGGNLNLGDAVIFAQGRGGNGGDGFSAEVGNGGDGGNGGNAQGGFIFLGSVSASDIASTGGSAAYGSVLADASAFGGNGGNGGFGSEGFSDGLGGDGGSAIGGEADLLVRGVAVTADSVDLIANATGGDGGSGSTSGDGGDAATGFVVVESRNRSGVTAQRGSLTAVAVTGSAIAQGGTGATDGTSTLRSGSYFSVVNGDAQIFVLDMTFAGDEYDGTFGPNFIQAENGVATISGLSYDTTGELAVYVAETASINGSSLFLTAGNFVDFAGAPEPLDPGTISYGNATILTGQDVYIDADLSIGSSLTIDAPGMIHAHDITIGDGDLDLLANGNIDIRDAEASGSVTLDSGANLTARDLTAGNTVDVTAVGSVTIRDVDASAFLAEAGTNLTTGLIESGSEIALDAGGAISTGDLFAGDFVLANGGSISTGDIDADSVEMTSTGGNISTGDIFAFGSVELDAFGDILAGDITAGSIDLLAGDDITTDNLTTQFLVLLAAQEGPGPSFLFPGASITLEAGGDIATDNIDSIDGVYADAGGSLTTGSIDAVDFAFLNSSANMQTGNITAGSDLRADSGGTMTLGTLSAFDIELDSGGSMSFVSADAGTEFDFSSGGAVTGGNVTAGDQISGDAAGNITLANLTVNGPPQEGENFSIGIIAAGNINVGNATAVGPVGFATLGNLTTGNISAGELVMALVDGNITINGSITTSGESGGQVYMADASMCEAGGGCNNDDEEGDFNPFAVLALDPVATGGSITINGPVSTGLFRASAGTNFTAQAINTGFGDIEVWAGGTATVNGAWAGSDIDVTSNNIDITGTGTITASDIVTLHSTNSQQTLIGDGLSGTGYALSNAEFSRVRGDSIAIVTGGVANAAADTLVGDLTITAGESGNIRNPEGGFGIVTLSESGESTDGTLRVVGDVNATGLTLDNFIAFATEHFELDAATGSVSLTSTGGTLSGELGLYADTIHVAEGSILDLLADNPTYTGYQQDLNEAATVQRPEGVLRADTIWIESDNLQDVLIQNTGTANAPAGFLARQAFINEDFDVAGPPGSINLIVNGQVVTEGGTLTGVAARDALITEETDITPFTSNSTINGCPLTGACIIVPPPPPTADLVDNFIDLLGNDPLGDSDFGNEDSIDDNQEGDEGANNPISPPQPLFDTRPLIPGGDVNDPVSGTGNPALLGSDQQCETEEGGQCPANPVNGDGQ